MSEVVHLQYQRLLVLGLLLAIACGVELALGLRLLRARRRQQPLPRGAALVFGGLLLLGLGGLADSLLLEPDWLQLTHFAVRTPRMPPRSHLRIIHLSDLHVEGWTRALEQLPEEINRLEPDLLIFTGDSLNSAQGLPVLHELLSRIHTRLGRFAVRGNHDVEIWNQLDVFGEGAARELRGEPLVLETPAGPLVLCGAPYGQPERLAECLQAHPDGLRIVAYHTPDEVEALAPLGPELYLAGHTHGGQVRMPFYGALITFSRFDKKYEMGWHTVDSTVLFVSRGVGFEPHLPRIRFLCRPEIAVIELLPPEDPPR